MSLRLNVNTEMNFYVPEAFYSLKVSLYAKTKQEYMTEIKNNNKTEGMTYCCHLAMTVSQL